MCGTTFSIMCENSLSQHFSPLPLSFRLGSSLQALLKRNRLDVAGICTRGLCRCGNLSASHLAGAATRGYWPLYGTALARILYLGRGHPWFCGLSTHVFLFNWRQSRSLSKTKHLID